MDKMSSLGAQNRRLHARSGGFEIICYKHFEIQRVASEDLVSTLCRPYVDPMSTLCRPYVDLV